MDQMISAPAASPAVTSITAALARVLKVEAASLGESTRLFDDLGLDSTTVLELLMELEDDLAVEFDPDTLEQRHFETVATLATLVAQQMQS
jgi:acyl carrier protein